MNFEVFHWNILLSVNFLFLKSVMYVLIERKWNLREHFQTMHMLVDAMGDAMSTTAWRCLTWMEKESIAKVISHKKGAKVSSKWMNKQHNRMHFIWPF